MPEPAKYEIIGQPFGTIKGNVIETGRPSSSHGLQHSFDERAGKLTIMLIEPPPNIVTDCEYFPETIEIPDGTKTIAYVRSNDISSGTALGGLELLASKA